MKAVFALVFALSLTLGFWLTEQAWNGQLYVYIGEERSPAAVRSISDYTKIDRKTLKRAVEEQLVADAQVLHKQGAFAVELGHPIVERKAGGKEFGCRVQDREGAYDHIELTFVGVGVSESGEPPKMTVKAECRSQLDLNKLEPVWIPLDDIKAAKTAEQVFQYEDQSSLSVHLDYVPMQWPDQWVLWSVKLSQDANANATLNVDAGQMKQARAGLLTIDLK